MGCFRPLTGWIEAFRHEIEREGKVSGGDLGPGKPAVIETGHVMHGKLGQIWRSATNRLGREALVRLGITACLISVFAVHASGLAEFRVVNYLEYLTYDTRLQADMPFSVDEDIVLVGVDEQSLAREGRWPWPRKRLADLFDRLFDDYDVRQLGIDGVFPEPEQPAAGGIGAGLFEEGVPGEQWPERELSPDQRLAQSMRGRDVILGMAFRDDGASSGVLPPSLGRTDALPGGLEPGVHSVFTANLPMLQGAARNAGFADIRLFDADGRVRRTPLLAVHEGSIYGSFPLVMARVAQGESPLALDAGGRFAGPEIALGERKIPVDSESALLIPYRGPRFSFPNVSAVDVLDGSADPELLEDAIVIFGASATGLGDFHATPVSDAMSSIEVHAHVISGLMDGRLMRAPGNAALVETGIIAGLGLILAGAYLLLGGWGSVAATLGVLAGYTAINLGLWRWMDLVLPLGSVVVFTALLYTLHLLYGHIRATRSRRELSTVFSHYVPQPLVEELMDNPEHVQLEGESREMTVLFSDIHGFAGIAESLDPRELTRLMNEFLTAMTQVIQRRRGTIDKYMGDSVMAFWGAPIHTPDHARQAVFAALEMQREMSRLNGRFRRRGWPVLSLGIGINTGHMSVGNMGSEFRMAYTVMGDAVNLGSRLEGLTRQFGIGIICSEYTRQAVPDVRFMELDRASVRGRGEPVTIYEPLGLPDELPEHTRRRASQFESALEDLRAERYREAAELLQGLMRDDPARARLYYHFLAQADERVREIESLAGESLTRGGL